MAVKQVSVLVNGVTTQLTLNPSTGLYEGTLAAPSKSSFNQENHYYNVAVTVADDAGNTVTKDSSDTELGDSLKLVVKETTAPVITISTPTASQLLTSNQPTISFTVTDNDSGVNASSIVVKVDGVAIADITKTKSGSGYNCSCQPPTPLDDGPHTVTVDAADNDGNEATQKSVQFTVDTVPPELSVTAPVNGLVTNKSSVTVTGTTNDVTSSPVTLTVNGEAVQVYDDGTFSTTIDLEEGENTITVIATDSAGKSTTVTRTVVKDVTPPQIKSISLTPNPATVGGSYKITVSVSD